MDVIDYKVQALKFILHYFRTNKDIVAIIRALASRFTSLQTAVSELRNCLNIQNARGVWLDYIGDEVGAQRDEVDFLLNAIEDIKRELENIKRNNKI